MRLAAALFCLSAFAASSVFAQSDAPRFSIAAFTQAVSFANADDIDGAVDPRRRIDGTLSRPAGVGPFPAVVLLHTCGGVQPHVREDWPRHLAVFGYVTLAVDSFGSRNLRACPNALHPARPPLINAYREMTRDAFGALDYLATLPYVAADRVAVMGFSLGANVINSFLIHQPPRAGRNFATAIGVYGRCHDLQRYNTPKTPLMEIAGERDEQHVGSCRAVARRVEVHVLPGAYHSWDDRQASGKMDANGNPMQFDAGATARSQELVRDFLLRQLGPVRPN